MGVFQKVSFKRNVPDLKRSVKMAFPEKLKALRLKHKLTQEELGEINE